MEISAGYRKRWLGIDFSGDYRKWSPGCGNSNVWIADVRREDQFVLRDLKTVQGLPGSGAPFHRLCELLKSRNFDAAGLDAPFSVPMEYMPSGGHHRLLEIVSKTERLENPWFPSANDFRSSVLAGRVLDKKPFRETEKYWTRPNLNPRSTLWDKARSGAAMTSACLTLLQQAQCPIWPWHPAGSAGLLVEAFPAAQLCYWGDLPYYGYSRNGTKALNNRRKIVEFLSKYIALNEAQSQTMENSADALDAVICAFAAIAVTTGCVFEPRRRPPKEEA